MRDGILGLLMAVVLSISIPVSAFAQTSLSFKLGFKALADQIPQVVGQPLEDEHWGSNGDSLQQTATGLLAWRKADNWTAFTNGSHSWINGPVGVQDRPNDWRFNWEGISADEAAQMILALPEVQALIQSTKTSGWRAVLQLVSDPAPLARLGSEESLYSIGLRGITQDTITRIDFFAVDPHTRNIFVENLWGEMVPLDVARATGWRAELRRSVTPTPQPSPTSVPTPTPTVPISPPNIPHPLAGMDNCTSCHRVGGSGVAIKGGTGIPTSHASYQSAQCRGCHKPA